MMSSTDFTRFLVRRLKSESPIVFFWRLVRFFYIFICYLLTRKEVTKGIYTINGSKMYLSPSDKGISSDLARSSVREPYMTTYLKNILYEGDIVVDIGANIGYYALLESRLVGASGHIYAIEPVLSNLGLLNSNIGLNGYTNISTYQYAIGSRLEEAEMFISDMCNMSTLKRSNFRTYTKVVKVPVTTLDKFLLGKKYPNLVRMDVEGFEYEVVEGALETLSTDKPLKIYMELHFDILRERSRDLLSRLKYFGFEVGMVSFEPHPLAKNKSLLRFLDTRIGLKTGYSDLTIKDLLDSKFTSGQVEDVEVLFIR